jgi:predicted component of type VI protein secretion system
LDALCNADADQLLKSAAREKGQENYHKSEQRRKNNRINISYTFNLYGSQDDYRAHGTA